MTKPCKSAQCQAQVPTTRTYCDHCWSIKRFFMGPSNRGKASGRARRERAIERDQQRLADWRAAVREEQPA